MYKETVMSDDFKQWKQAINNEYKFLETNFTWNLVKMLLTDMFKNKWVFVTNKTLTIWLYNIRLNE
jgi:hypothetical protein